MSTLRSQESGLRSAAEIHQLYRGMIASGQLGSGERLPTVRQTAADLGVALATAAKAYKLLEQEGLIVTRTAAGSRVADGAATLPAPIVTRIRDLVSAAQREQINLDDVISGIRAISSASPTKG
jgi:GntR family transcriptional regulator